MKTRQQLRQQLCNQRRSLSLSERDLAAFSLAKHVTENQLFQQSRHIASFHPVGGEMDPGIIVKIARELGKICYLPVLNTTNSLCFISHQPGEPLLPNRYKIPEPELNVEKMIAPKELDLVLVPLVGFDLKGNRLGMGAGYYDRTFGFLLEHPRPGRPYLLGLAYEWQRIDEFAPAEWDVPLDAVATEEKIYFRLTEA